MKKLIALLLVAIMCFALVACTNDEEIKKLNERIEKLEAQLDNKEPNSNLADTTTNIIGTWEGAVSGVTFNFTFNEDGTGSLSASASSNTSLKWKYNSELESYIICYSNGNMGCLYDIETDENGKQYINLSGSKLYRVDN